MVPFAPLNMPLTVRADQVRVSGAVPGLNCGRKLPFEKHAQFQDSRFLLEASMKPTYFDLTVHDIGQAKAFFESVLGWRFEQFPMPYEYYRIQAGPEGEPGIDGGIGAVKDASVVGGKPMTQVTVPVVDLDETIARVKANGGQIVESKLAVPGIGWYATCAEPGGLRFGVIQADPNAA